MLRKKFDHFVEEICKYNNFTQDKTEEIQYVMRLMMYEALKIIIMFSILGYSKEVVLITFTMICVKPFTGGYHETSQKRCLIATTILCCLTILIKKIAISK